MAAFAPVLALALLPAAGNFAGGLLAELVAARERWLSRALHVAAGIVIAVVAVEIMPNALGAAPGWALTVAFVLGGLFYTGVEWLVGKLQRGRRGAWMVYFAVCMDLFSDGLLIGAGGASSASLALVLAVGQVLADVPEGFATIVDFKHKGVARRRRLLLSASFAVPVVVAASIAYLLLRQESEALKMSAVVFSAGPIVVGAVEDMISEAHESAAHTRASSLFFVFGFALFTLVPTLFDA